MRKYLSDKAGSTTVIFSLSAVALLAACGAAIDYVRILNARTELQTKLDAATLATARSLTENSARKEAAKLANAVGKTFSTIDDSNTVVRNAKFDFDVKKDKIIGSAVGQVPLSLMSIFVGGQYSEVSAVAEANIGSDWHLELHFVMDVSESMNIAATPNDILKLKAATKPYTDVSSDADISGMGGCAFACHFRHESGFEPAGKTMLDLAREAGVQLRSDVMREGANKLSAELSAEMGNNVTFGVLQSSNNIERALKPTSVKSRVEDAINELAVVSEDTGFSDQLSDAADLIGAGGGGEKSSDPAKIAVLITDGAMGGRGGKSPISTDGCDKLKAQNVRVAVIYIKQLDPLNSFAYDEWVKPQLAEIEDQLVRCASSADDIVVAQDASEISLAFLKMADKFKKQRNLALSR